MERSVIIADQSRAAELLVELLRLQAKTDDLPPLAWEVYCAGCLLIGQVTQGKDHRAAWMAWADKLELTQRSERVAGTQVALTARGRVGEVQVAIQTTVPKPYRRG